MSDAVIGNVAMVDTVTVGAATVSVMAVVSCSKLTGIRQMIRRGGGIIIHDDVNPCEYYVMVMMIMASSNTWNFDMIFSGHHASCSPQEVIQDFAMKIECGEIASW